MQIYLVINVQYIFHCNKCSFWKCYPTLRTYSIAFIIHIAYDFVAFDLATTVNVSESQIVGRRLYKQLSENDYFKEILH